VGETVWDSGRTFEGGWEGKWNNRYTLIYGDRNSTYRVRETGTVNTETQ
jgi:hypothetical protein